MSTTATAARPDLAPESPPPLLPYADLPSRWGVCVERLPDGVRVVVPPVPNWRRLHAGFYVGGSVLALVVVGVAVAAVNTGDWLPMLPNGLLYGGGLLWVLLAARYRLRRRIAFEITRHTVSTTYLSGRSGSRRVEWPRARVSEIKLNSSNGKLIVRVTGVAFVELYLGPNRDLNAYVAQVLATALREPPPAQPVIDPAEPAPAAAPPPRGVRSRALRRALLAVSVVMAAAGLVMMFLPLPAQPIGFYLLLFAGAPAGIALGTQDKEFYV
jgi:hypothetical protein